MADNEGNGINKLLLGLFTIFILIFLIGYGQLFNIYAGESKDMTMTLKQGMRSADLEHPHQVEPGFEGTAQVVAVDPIKGELVLRIKIEAVGDYLDAQGGPNSDITLDVNSISGKSEINYKKGEYISPVDVVLSLAGGAGRYPFDSQEADLDYQVNFKNEEGEWRSAPVKMILNTAYPGYHIEVTERVQQSSCAVMAHFGVTRARSVLLFDGFLMALMGVLGLASLFVSLVIVSGRKLELPFFQWMATLMFALLPLRNAMPSAPPIGVLADYLSFFWAEALIAISLLAAVVVWLFRRN